MSHTLGPWEAIGQLIVGPPESLPNPKAEPRGKVVASICWDYLGNHGATEPRIKWTGEGAANANLIAAAPDLLAALRNLVHMNACNYDRDTEDYRKALIQAASAIAKAEGITL